VRVGNLLGIRLGINLVRPGGPGKEYILTFPDYDVKNRVDLNFPFSARATGLIDRYIAKFRVHLKNGRHGDWLFPGDGKQRDPKHASDTIAKRMLKETGLRITAHQFRHAAAAFILRKHPGNYEYVRRILGHRSVATTTHFYIGLEGFQASEHFGKLVEDRLSQGLGD
jgi:integrase